MFVFDEKEKYKIKVPNFRQEILKHLNETYKQEIRPEEIFNYIYAILYAPSYREQYNEFLKIDFTRIPFTDDFKLFKKLGDLGKELIELHLLKSSSLKSSFIKFPAKETDIIDKVIYDKKARRIYINEQQYFECTPEELWEYYIGSYQVLEKWLKDRSGKKPSLNEIDHYFKIAMALKETIEIQNKINKNFQEIEK